MLAAVDVLHDQSRRPNSIESVHSAWIVLDVELNRNEVVSDVLFDLGVGIRHGTHLLAAASFGVEQVDQNQLVRAARLRSRLVHGIKPRNVVGSHAITSWIPAFAGMTGLWILHSLVP